MVNQYNYRKLFGLSYKEFMNEPADVFMVNTEIGSILTGIERHELKKMRKS